MVSFSLQHVKLSKKVTLYSTVQYIYIAIQDEEKKSYLCKGSFLHENLFKTTFNFLKVVRNIWFPTSFEWHIRPSRCPPWGYWPIGQSLRHYHYQSNHSRHSVFCLIIEIFYTFYFRNPYNFFSFQEVKHTIPKYARPLRDKYWILKSLFKSWKKQYVKQKLTIKLNKNLIYFIWFQVHNSTNIYRALE